MPTFHPPRPEYQEVGESGKRTLWVVFVIMVIASAVFAGLSWKVPVSKRLFHIITTLITIFASLSYFAMASGAGTSFVCEKVKDYHEHVPDTYHTVCRQVFWARYVDWTLTTPILLWELCILGGIDGAHTLMATASSLVMTLAGLFAAYGDKHTAQRWGWFAIAVLGYVFVVWHVALNGSRTVRAKGDKVAKLFGGLAGYIFIIWTVYPIVWGIAEGAHKTTVDTGVVIYGVLDILAKTGFGLYLLVTQRQVPEANVDIDGYWSNGLANEGRIRIGDDA